VVQSDIVNAFVLPGGKVFVFTGILKFLKTDDGAASIIGHEIAHALLRHHAERLTKYYMVIFSEDILSIIFNIRMGISRMILASLIMSGFSRTHENEADEVGLMLMSRACYDPREMPHVFERIDKYEAQTGKNRGGFLQKLFATHPSHEERIGKLNKLQQRALTERQKHCVANDARDFDAFATDTAATAHTETQEEVMDLNNNFNHTNNNDDTDEQFPNDKEETRKY